jgi:hypothetical protein
VASDPLIEFQVTKNTKGTSEALLDIGALCFRRWEALRRQSHGGALWVQITDSGTLQFCFDAHSHYLPQYSLGPKNSFRRCYACLNNDSNELLFDKTINKMHSSA